MDRMGNCTHIGQFSLGRTFGTITELSFKMNIFFLIFMSGHYNYGYTLLISHNITMIRLERAVVPVQ